MKRKIWNQTSIPNTRPTGLYISVNPKSGGMSFSKDLTEKLQQMGGGINLIQDEDRPTDWYIEVSKDTEAFQIRVKPETTSGIIQSTHLVRELLTTCGLEKKSYRFMVAAEPIEKNLYAILTKSANHRTLKKAS